MINIDIDAGDIIASMALIFSFYATFKTIQFNNRQQDLIKTQATLNQLLLEKETAEADLERQAEVSVNFLRLGNNKCKLKVFNKGRAPARDVTIEFPEGNDVVSESDINSKFPLQSLDVHQSVELIASIYLGSKSKHLVKLQWTDGRSERVTKEMWATH